VATDNCYLGWFWDNETRTKKRWKDLIKKEQESGKVLAPGEQG